MRISLHLLRLHRDGSGLASIEFVLAAPVIMLLVIFVVHAHQLSTKRIDTMREIRTAAFAKANGLQCTTEFGALLPIGDLVPAGLPGSQDSLRCSSQVSTEGGGDPARTAIWDDIIQQGKGASENIAGELANEKPNLVTASATRIYRYSKQPQFSWAPVPRPYRWKDSFTVDDTTLFASTKDVTRRGYDPVLRKEIADVGPDSEDLFDGIFPGARR